MCSKMRRKADGTAFEGEFMRAMQDTHYVKRLRTTNTGYAGVREPADFIVVKNKFSYVELKETAGNAFSITGMEQFDKMKEFIEVVRELHGKVTIPLKYWLVVHFLKDGCIKAISGEQALEMSTTRAALRDNSPVLTFQSLEELKGADLF